MQEGAGVSTLSCQPACRAAAWALWADAALAGRKRSGALARAVRLSQGSGAKYTALHDSPGAGGVRVALEPFAVHAAHEPVRGRAVLEA